MTGSVPIADLQIVLHHNLSAVMGHPRICQEEEVFLLWIRLLVQVNYIGHRYCNTLH